MTEHQVCVSLTFLWLALQMLKITAPLPHILQTREECCDPQVDTWAHKVSIWKYVHPWVEQSVRVHSHVLQARGDGGYWTLTSAYEVLSVSYSVRLSFCVWGSVDNTGSGIAEFKWSLDASEGKPWGTFVLDDTVEQSKLFRSLHLKMHSHSQRMDYLLLLCVCVFVLYIWPKPDLHLCKCMCAFWLRLSAASMYRN